MKKRYEKQIEIAVSPETVFTFVSDLRNCVKWSNALTATLSSGDGKLDSTYRILAPTLVSKQHLTLQVTNYISPTQFAYKDLSLFFHNETGFVLTGEETTLLTLYQEAEVGFLSKVYLGNQTERELEKSLQKIKALLETEETGTPIMKQDSSPLPPSPEDNSEDLSSLFSESPEEVKRRFKKKNY